LASFVFLGFFLDYLPKPSPPDELTPKFMVQGEAPKKKANPETHRTFQKRLRHLTNMCGEAWNHRTTTAKTNPVRNSCGNSIAGQADNGILAGKSRTITKNCLPSGPLAAQGRNVVACLSVADVNPLPGGGERGALRQPTRSD